MCIEIKNNVHIHMLIDMNYIYTIKGITRIFRRAVYKPDCKYYVYRVYERKAYTYV